MTVVVHPANIQESEGAKLVLRRVLDHMSRLQKIWVDQGYKRHFVDWARGLRDWEIEVVARPQDAKGWVLLPRRWVVERTFAWLGRCRRLSKDYEALPETGEAWIRLAMIHLMLKRLAPP